MLLKLSLLLITVLALLGCTSQISYKEVIVYAPSSVCRQYTSGTCSKSITILDPITLNATTLRIGVFGVNSQLMSPSGDRVSFYAGRRNRTTINVMDIQTRLQARVVDPIENPTYSSWSHNGSYLAYTASIGQYNGKEKIYIVERNGRNRKQISRDLEVFAGIAWSPVEEKLAFTAREPYEAISSFYIYDLKRHEIRRIASSIGHNQVSEWSPDGQKIAFVSDRTGKPQVYIVDLLTGDVSQVTDEIDGASAPYWAFGGKSIVYYMMNWKEYYFKMIDLETKTVTLIPMTGNVGSADVSPDGNEMVYVQMASPDSRLCIVNLRDLSNRCLDVEAPFMQGEPHWVRVQD